MFRKTQILLWMVLVLGTNSSFSQKLLKKAEMQMESEDFREAVVSYKAYLKDHASDFTVIGKLADAYAASGELTEAINQFKSIPENQISDPSVLKNYGIVLKKTGKYHDAIAIFEKYRVFQPEEGDHLIKSANYAINTMSGKPAYETFIMPSNSSVSDFGLTFYKNLPVFSSFRSDILMTEAEKELNIQNTAHKTFLYNQKKNRLGFIKDKDGNMNHMGPISFSGNGLSCAMINSDIKDNYNFITTGNNSSLHIAIVNEKGEITSSKPFLYNEVGSSINAAHMAFDGTALYFSSNRKGGYGQYDIYISYLNDGLWSLPKNLGSEINTSGNEITPFLKDNTLYFSSDYHIGLGGFDILKSESKNGIWETPLNVGYGVNSLNDDYFPAFNSFGELYVTSNRLGGKGSNDIYKTFNLEEKTEDYSNIPAAVSLDELATVTLEHTGNSEISSAVANRESEVKVISAKSDNEMERSAFTLPEFDVLKVGNMESEFISLEGAHRIAIDELIPNTEVFFIQLASVSSVKPNFSRFKPLIRFGNVYKISNNKAIKVRLGYFTDRKEAEEILSKVRSNGFKDAFITFEVLNTAQMELILSSTDDNSFIDEGNLNSKNPTEEIKNFKVGSKYKVRLASYEDPIWFDINKVKDLGRIEQWTKGGWTIFILAGYTNLEEAKLAMIQSINRGFKTAEVVIDNGGILERMKQN